MKIRNSLFAVFVVTSLFACGGGDDAPPIGPSITAKITVANLPEMLLINNPTTKDNSSEYAWSVIFDLDDNGTRSVGDIELELVHFKWPDSQQMQAKVSDFETLVFEFTAADRLTQITTGNVQISGNTITLTVAKSQHEALNKIDYSTKVQFQTIGYDINGEGYTQGQGQAYGDSFPVEMSVATFASIPVGGILEDTDSGMSELLGVDIRHVDLQTMEVIID